jgi:hypothetical protein
MWHSGCIFRRVSRCFYWLLKDEKSTQKVATKLETRKSTGPLAQSIATHVDHFLSISLKRRGFIYINNKSKKQQKKLKSFKGVVLLYPIISLLAEIKQAPQSL